MKSWEQYLGRLLIALRLDSIKNKIVALALIAMLLPALSTAVLSYVQNRRALTETLEGELRGIGSQSAREIDLWIRDRRYDVRVFESSFEVRENLDRLAEGGPAAIDAQARLTDYLTGVQELFLYYAELMAVDAEGRPVASSRLPLRDFVLPNEWLPTLRFGEAVLGEPYYDQELGETAFTIAQPIEAPDGRFLGALVATVTFSGVDVILAGFARGEAGRVDLIDAEGRRIVGSTDDQAPEPVVSAEALLAMRAEGGGTAEFAGDDGLVLGTVTDVPQLGWSVVTQIPTDEAYAQVTQLRNSTTLLISGLFVIVGGIAYLLGLFIVRPLARLSVGAAAVSRGDLSVDLPVTGGGEVGALTQAFNRMVGQLRRSRAELSNANAALREHNVELERLSMTDALTGLYNRRYVMNEIDKELHRAGRYGRGVGLLMLDVDRFKVYNDTHGHLAGDQVLTGIGRVIEDATREHDVPGRFGGEEFIVLLPDCDLRGAVDAAERIRRRLTEEVFKGGAVTCSIGAAAYPDHGVEPNELIAQADAALYEAKSAGRDRVKAAIVRKSSDRTEEDPTLKRRSPEAKRAAVKEAPASKPAAKKATAKKATAKRAGTKKAESKKPATKKPATKKTAAGKAPPKKRTTKKAAAKESASKKPATEKGAAQKPAEKKKATKKATSE